MASSYSFISDEDFISLNESIKKFISTEKISNPSEIPGLCSYLKLIDFALENSKDGDLWLFAGCFLGKNASYAIDYIKNSGRYIKVYCLDEWECSELPIQIQQHFQGSSDLFPYFVKSISDLDQVAYVEAVKSDVETSIKYFESGDRARFKFNFVDRQINVLENDLFLLQHLTTNDGFIGGPNIHQQEIHDIVIKQFPNGYIRNSSNKFSYWMVSRQE